MKTPRPRPPAPALPDDFCLAAMASASLARADSESARLRPRTRRDAGGASRRGRLCRRFAAECGADTAPIHGAFESYLARKGLGDGERDALRRQFSRVETTTIALDKTPAPRCAEMHEVELTAIHRLEGRTRAGSAGSAFSSFRFRGNDGRRVARPTIQGRISSSDTGESSMVTGRRAMMSPSPCTGSPGGPSMTTRWPTTISMSGSFARFPMPRAIA